MEGTMAVLRVWIHPNVVQGRQSLVDRACGDSFDEGLDPIDGVIPSSELSWTRQA
jgi:hypothetical protein